MERRLFALFFFILVMAVPLRMLGQQNFATNLSHEVSDDKLLITFDAMPSGGVQFFNIILIITYDGKPVKVNSAYGDFGNNIAAGADKSIVWYFKDDFKQDISRVTVDVFAYKMSEPKAVFRIVSISNNGYAPATVKFQNSSVDATQFSWNFGDPVSGFYNTSTEREPEHTFQNGGTYTVILTSESPDGESSFYQSIEIKSYDPVIAGFTYDITGKKAPYTVKFRNSSKEADEYTWDFGDPKAGKKANISNKANPDYKYKESGTYLVILTAKSKVSGMIDIFSSEVTIEAPEVPKAGFIVNLIGETTPVVAIFKNSSVNTTAWKWDFGDPGSGKLNSSTEENPSHTFSSPGKYTVKLTATGSNKKNYQHSETITLEGPQPDPVAGFSIENNNSIAPVSIIFRNSSVHADFYSWDFGDPGSGSQNSSGDENPVHTYKTPGRYPVRLKVTQDKTGKTAEFSDVVIVTEVSLPVVAAFNITNNNALAPAVVRFVNTSENGSLFEWNFGDPASGSSNVSTEKAPEHTYTKAGSYKVTLKVTGSAKGDVKEISQTVTVREELLTPVADFTYTLNGQYAPLEVVFANSSANADSYKWDFGDPKSRNNTSTQSAPRFTYDKPGDYTITLEVKNNKSGRTHKVQKEITISEKYVTFVKTVGKNNSNEIATAVIRSGVDEYLVVVNENETGSIIVRTNSEGTVFNEKRINANVFDILQKPDNKGYLLAGVSRPNDLILCNTDNQLNFGTPTIIYNNLLDPGFSFSNARIAMNKVGEVAVAGNLVNNRGETNIWFQKATLSGDAIPQKGKTFRFIGFKTVNQLIPTSSGFAITGLYKQDQSYSNEMMLAKVDKAGTGTIHSMRSKANMTGCDLVELANGHFHIVAGRETSNPGMSEVSLKLVDSDITPLNCEIAFDELTRTPDVAKFPPRVIQSRDGFIILSHYFNGSDTDMVLYWVDQSGAILRRKEILKREGDQWGTAILENDDRSLIIVGAEKRGNDYNALIIKTDRFGKLLN